MINTSDLNPIRLKHNISCPDFWPKGGRPGRRIGGDGAGKAVYIFYSLGEVEGVWIRYGSNYAFKYVHVKDPTVAVGDTISAGQKIGSTVSMGGGQYFWELEIQRLNSNSTIDSIAWNTLVNTSNKSAFDGLWSSSVCNSSQTWYSSPGVTTTASDWKNDQNVAGAIDSTNKSQPCAF